jgi:hypothetical protein
MNAIVAEATCHHRHLNPDQVRDFFRSSPYPHLASFVAAVDGSEVVLEGVSPSFHSKQLAQNVAARCPGVTCVKNLIHVLYER